MFFAVCAIDFSDEHVLVFGTLGESSARLRPQLEFVSLVTGEVHALLAVVPRQQRGCFCVRLRNRYYSGGGPFHMSEIVPSELEVGAGEGSGADSGTGVTHTGIPDSTMGAGVGAGTGTSVADAGASVGAGTGASAAASPARYEGGGCRRMTLSCAIQTIACRLRLPQP